MNIGFADLKISITIKTWVWFIPLCLKNLIIGTKAICLNCRQVSVIRGFIYKGLLSRFKCKCGYHDGLFYFGQAVPKNRNYFNSFFDYVNSKTIWKPEHIRQFERQGQIFASQREFEERTKKVKKMKQDALAYDRRKRSEEMVRKIYQGYSYKRELIKKGLMDKSHWND